MSEVIEIEGKVKMVNETQTFPSGFCKRPVVVTTLDRYPQDLEIEFIKDNITKLDNVVVGKSVRIAVNIRGSEHKGRRYTTLVGWRLTHVGEAVNTQEPEAEQAHPDDGQNFPF